MKTIVVTPAFCKSDMLKHSLENYYHFQCGNFEHWILLNHYPINEEQNNKEIIEIANKYGCKVFDNKYDRGLHNGLNNFLINNSLPQGSIMIGFDPDSAIEDMSHGFDLELVNTLIEGRDKNNIAVLGLWGIGIDSKWREPKNRHYYNKTFINGNAVLIHPDIEMFSIVAWDLDFINAIGGFNQPNNYYGGIEIAIHQGLSKFQKKLAYLTEYKEKYFAYPQNEVLDQEYIDWKQQHINGFKGSLKDYIQQLGKTCKGVL